MPEGNRELETVIHYMQSHWPSKVKDEWQVKLEEYPSLAKKAYLDLTDGKTKNRHLFRIAGPSGSGKTTQILPAVEAYSEKKHLKPVLVAARCFVNYHPHYEEIKEYYGDENLRKMTDEFSTIMLFLVLASLMENGFDIILDVTLLDPKIEGILLKKLSDEKYESLILMIAASPTVTEHFLSGRNWRHSKETEQEFIRATVKALEFYAKTAPENHIILWSVYDEPPIYDGPVKASLEIFNDYSSRETLPLKNDDARREAKNKYLQALDI